MYICYGKKYYFSTIMLVICNFDLFMSKFLVGKW